MQGAYKCSKYVHKQNVKKIMYVYCDFMHFFDGTSTEIRNNFCFYFILCCLSTEFPKQYDYKYKRTVVVIKK